MRLSYCFPLVGLAFLGACGGIPDPAHNAYGTWKGQLVTEEGECPTKDESLLIVRGKTLIFTPGISTSVLRGSYSKGISTFKAEQTDKGMNDTSYQQVFKAYPVGQQIGGTYASPRCRARITLTRE